LVGQLVLKILHVSLQLDARDANKRLPGAERLSEAKFLVAQEDFASQFVHLRVLGLLIGCGAIEHDDIGGEFGAFGFLGLSKRGGLGKLGLRLGEGFLELGDFVGLRGKLGVKDFDFFVRRVLIVGDVLGELLDLRVEIFVLAIQFALGGLEHGVVVLSGAQLEHGIAQRFTHADFGGIGLVNGSRFSGEERHGQDGGDEGDKVSGHRSEFGVEVELEDVGFEGGASNAVGAHPARGEPYAGGEPEAAAQREPFQIGAAAAEV